MRLCRRAAQQTAPSTEDERRGGIRIQGGIEIKDQTSFRGVTSLPLRAAQTLCSCRLAPLPAPSAAASVAPPPPRERPDKVGREVCFVFGMRKERVNIRNSESVIYHEVGHFLVHLSLLIFGLFLHKPLVQRQVAAGMREARLRGVGSGG